MADLPGIVNYLRVRAHRVVLSVVVLCAAAAAVVAALVSWPATAATRVMPGSFTGYAFDTRCAPSQSQMDAWWAGSPFAGVGVYIGGSLRDCRDQPNLTADWIATQSRRGWRVLPIWVGPQASCARYADRVDAAPAGDYAAARRQGRAEADRAVAAAQGLGIRTGSTLWYDLESFSLSDDDCRRSALDFLSSWTRRLHALRFRSGVYSSVAAGIHALDHADAVSRGSYRMPDQVWYAWDNGRADTAIAQKWVRPRSWASPAARVHQYDLDTTATYGGVTLRIDRSFMDVGRGSVAPPAGRFCGVRSDFPDYRPLAPGSRGVQVQALQCLLRRKHVYDGPVHGRFDDRTTRAVRSFEGSHGLPVDGRVTGRTWTVLLAEGSAPLLKVGSADDAVRRLQRALNVAADAHLRVTGVFSAPTERWVRAYQRQRGLPPTGVVTGSVWDELLQGRR